MFLGTDLLRKFALETPRDTGIIIEWSLEGRIDLDDIENNNHWRRLFGDNVRLRNRVSDFEFQNIRKCVLRFTLGSQRREFIFIGAIGKCII